MWQSVLQAPLVAAANMWLHNSPLKPAYDGEQYSPGRVHRDFMRSKPYAQNVDTETQYIHKYLLESRKNLICLQPRTACFEILYSCLLINALGQTADLARCNKPCERSKQCAQKIWMGALCLAGITMSGKCHVLTVCHAGVLEANQHWTSSIPQYQHLHCQER